MNRRAGLLTRDAVKRLGAGEALSEAGITVQRLAEDGVWRVAFKLTPKGSQNVDLRCYLTLYGEALSETWTDLYTP